MFKLVFTGALAVAILAGCTPLQPGASSPDSAAAAPASTMSDQQLVASLSTNGARYTQQGGQNVYRAICQACHMADGQGATSGAGYFPDLRSSPKLASAVYPAIVVMNGWHGMPPFGAQLSDQQVADVVNYLRTNFGNAYSDALTASSVAALRPAK